MNMISSFGGNVFNYLGSCFASTESSSGSSNSNINAGLNFNFKLKNFDNNITNTTETVKDIFSNDDGFLTFNDDDVSVDNILLSNDESSDSDDSLFSLNGNSETILNRNVTKRNNDYFLQYNKDFSRKSDVKYSVINDLKDGFAYVYQATILYNTSIKDVVDAVFKTVKKNVISPIYEFDRNEISDKLKKFTTYTRTVSGLFGAAGFTVGAVLFLGTLNPNFLWLSIAGTLVGAVVGFVMDVMRMSGLFEVYELLRLLGAATLADYIESKMDHLLENSESIAQASSLYDYVSADKNLRKHFIYYLNENKLKLPFFDYNKANPQVVKTFTEADAKKTFEDFLGSKHFINYVSDANPSLTDNNSDTISEPLDSVEIRRNAKRREIEAKYEKDEPKNLMDTLIWQMIKSEVLPNNLSVTRRNLSSYPILIASLFAGTGLMVGGVGGATVSSIVGPAGSLIIGMGSAIAASMVFYSAGAILGTAFALVHGLLSDILELETYGNTTSEAELIRSGETEISDNAPITKKIASAIVSILGIVAGAPYTLLSPNSIWKAHAIDIGAIGALLLYPLYCFVHDMWKLIKGAGMSRTYRAFLYELDRKNSENSMISV